MKTTPLIKLRNLSVEFNRWGQSLLALSGINLDVFPKEWVTIVGHNGSGKSTLLNAIAGNIVLSQGNVEIIDIHNSETALFFITQDPLAGTADGLTLIENLVVSDPSPNKIPLNATSRKKMYSNLLDEFGLTSRANQLLKYFSGGERQQIALLIAKIRKPKILLLDEPFASLDKVKVPKCIDAIKCLNLDGCTILQITHDHDFAQMYSDRTITLENGRIVNNRINKPYAEKHVHTLKK